MAYGTIKIDTITFTDGGIDKSVAISGLVQNPTFTGNVTVTGTISGNTVRGQTISGVTVTGTTANFTSGNFTNISGGTHTITSGVFASGTAANPSISFVSDPNTGLYSPGADQVAISTNGTGRLFVDASGNVGTNGAPSTTANSFGYRNFELKGASTDRTGLLRFTDSAGTTAGTLLCNEVTGFQFAQDLARPITFFINNTERMRLDSSGRLGLGTSSPGAPLEIYAAANSELRLNTSADGYLQVGQFTNGAFIGPSSSDIVDGVLRLGTGGTERLRIDNAGNVGIGTATPGYLLDLAGTSPAMRLKGTAGTGFIADQNTSTGLVSLINYDNAALRFGTNQNEVARFDTSGRLLVGTSTSRSDFVGISPRLQVEGADQSTSTISAVRNSNDFAGSALFLAKSRGTTAGAVTVVQNNDLLGGVYFMGADGTNVEIGAQITGEVDGTPGNNDLPSRLVFSTTADGASSPTERMRITSGGNVACGVGADTTVRLHAMVASGSDRDIIRGSVDGVTNGLMVGWANSSSTLSVKFASIPTTASAANAFLDDTDSNRLYRSTSSIRYKTDVEDIDQSRADAVLNLRPVWYRSKGINDRSDWSWYGLIAEEVAEIEPRLVHWSYLEEDYEIEKTNEGIQKTLKAGAKLAPDGVQYERLTVLLLDVVKRQNARIETLEAKVVALEGV